MYKFRALAALASIMLCVTLLSAALVLPSLRGTGQCSTQHAAIARAARPHCLDTPRFWENASFWENAMRVSKAVGKDGLLAAAPSMGKEGLQTVAVSGKEGLQTVAVCVILGCWLLGASILLCAYLNKLPASTAAQVVFGVITASGLFLFPAWRKANELLRRCPAQNCAPPLPTPQHPQTRTTPPYHVPVQHPYPSILHRSDSAAIPD